MKLAPEIRVYDGQGQIRCPVCEEWRLELMATLPAPQPPPAIIEASKLSAARESVKGMLSGVCIGCFIRGAAGMVAAARSSTAAENEASEPDPDTN